MGSNKQLTFVILARWECRFPTDDPGPSHTSPTRPEGSLHSNRIRRKFPYENKKRREKTKRSSWLSFCGREPMATTNVLIGPHTGMNKFRSSQINCNQFLKQFLLDLTIEKTWFIFLGYLLFVYFPYYNVLDLMNCPTVIYKENFSCFWNHFINCDGKPTFSD